MIKRIVQVWKNKKAGFLTPFVMMLVLFGTPIGLVSADFGLRVYLSQDLRSTLDNAVLTAVSNVEYDATGHVTINEDRAREEIGMILGDALTDGGLVNADGTTDDYNVNLLDRSPNITFHLVNPDPGESASGSFTYTYWVRASNGTHVWVDETEQFVASGNGTHTRVTEEYDYTDITNPTLFVHVDLEYSRPLLSFMKPQLFQRVSGAEVFVGNERVNRD